MRLQLLAIPLVFLAIFALTVRAEAQQDQGCCQFLKRPDASNSASGRRCVDQLNRQSCVTLRPLATFFRDWRCDTRTQRCARSLPPTPPSPTPTPTPTLTSTPTRTPTAERVGCCQLDNIRRVRHPVCGNAIRESSCLNDFDGTATFCPDCVCSTHLEPGFEFGPGVCVTRTPTQTPTPTPTATPANPRGCCQLNKLPGAPSSICGNDVSRSSCEHDFGGEPVFCVNCGCSSHSGAGFDVAFGVCLPPRTPGHPRPPHQPHQPGS